MSETDVDFNITVAIPDSELRHPGSKQYTAYHVQVTSFSCKTQRSMEWRVLRRYSEFLGLYQQLKKSYPLQFQDVLFPSKRMIGRFNPEFVERRRMALQKFLEQTMEHPEIINSSSELRAFVEIDKNLTLVMEKEKEDLRLIVEQALGDPVKQQQLQFARCLFDFEARNEEELELKAGDIVVVTDTRDNNGWWQGQYHGRCGFFPINYVEKLDDVPDNVDEIIRGKSSDAPSVPDPVVPKRLSMVTQTKRRTVLFEQMSVQNALELEAAATAAPAVPASEGESSESAAPTTDSAATDEVPSDGDATASKRSTTTKELPPTPSSEPAPAPEKDSTDSTSEEDHTRPVISAAHAESASVVARHPRASLDSNGLTYVRGKAKYTFKGETAFELSFKKGDEVDVYTIDHSTGWWQGRSGGEIGYFPGTYVDVPEFAEDVLPVEKVEDEEEVAEEQDAGAVAGGGESNASASTEGEAETKSDVSKDRLTQLGAKIMPIVPSNAEVLSMHQKRKTRLAEKGDEAPQPSVEKDAPPPAVSSEEQNLACILCICEHWHPLEWERNLCKNCRHLKKMHRKQS